MTAESALGRADRFRSGADEGNSTFDSDLQEVITGKRPCSRWEFEIHRGDVLSAARKVREVLWRIPQILNLK